MFPQITSPRNLNSLTRSPRAVAGGLIFLFSILLTLHPALADEGSVDDLPQAVIDALESEVPGLVFTEIQIEEEDDGTEYEIHGIWQTREVEAKLNEQGVFLDLDIGDPEDGGDDNDLPSPISNALDALFDVPAVTSFEHITRGELEFYDIQASVAGRTMTIRISPGGILLSVETHGLTADPALGVPVDASSLPQLVMDAIGDLQATSRLRIAEPEVMYLIEGSLGKLHVTMLVGEGGELLGYELDRDADGISDLAEAAGSTSFSAWDTDGDNYPDGFEILKQTDPLDATAFPQIVNVEIGGEVIRLTVETFRGADFFLEQCGDVAGTWDIFGGGQIGDGKVHEIVLPLAEEIERCFFRIKIVPNTNGGGSTGTNSTSSPHCDLPTALGGGEIEISDDDGESRSLNFKTGTRGEIVEREDGEIEITPFAYTFEKTGECELRVTLTFSTSDGFETEIFTLKFSSDSEGAYSSQEYEHGEPEDPEEGDFTLTMN